MVSSLARQIAAKGNQPEDERRLAWCLKSCTRMGPQRLSRHGCHLQTVETKCTTKCGSWKCSISIVSRSVVRINLNLPKHKAINQKCPGLWHSDSNIQKLLLHDAQTSHRQCLGRNLPCGHKHDQRDDLSSSKPHCRNKQNC